MNDKDKKMSKKEKLLIYPSSKELNNEYINNLYNTIRDNYDVLSYGKKKRIKDLLSAKIHHFNWIESNSNNKVKIIVIIIYIIFLKILNKKIVWTVHNNVPHDIKNTKQIIKFMKFMAKISNRIHILCKDTTSNKILCKYKKKIVHIPHGDYINNYPNSKINIYDRYKINNKKKIILFIGQVRKYKNIELLIKAFKESGIEEEGLVLLICGSCSDEEYKNKILNEINDNIFVDFNFIKNEEMESYLRNSQIIVGPYNKTSSLNSGTLWMAMSYKKTMMLPLIGCVKDIKNYDEFLYIYDYRNNDDHYEALLKEMIKLKKDVIKNNNILDVKGKKAYDYILNNQTWKKYKREWINLYKFNR